MRYLLVLASLLFLAACGSENKPADTVKPKALWALKLCEGSSGFYTNCEVVDDKIISFDQCVMDQREFSKMLPRGERRAVVCLQ